MQALQDGQSGMTRHGVAFLGKKQFKCVYIGQDKLVKMSLLVKERIITN